MQSDDEVYGNGMITNATAEKLLNMRKFPSDITKRWDFPVQNKISIPLRAEGSKEEFFLDITDCGERVNLRKVTYNHRVRKSINLVRIDVNGTNHMNPDHKIIKGSHIHYYREKYNDSWAEPLSCSDFPDISDIYKVLESFMDYCNINPKPIINKGLYNG